MIVDKVCLAHVLGPDPVPPGDAALANAVVRGLHAPLERLLAVCVSAWRRPYLEKAAFPFRVDRAVRELVPQARDQVAQNAARARLELASSFRVVDLLTEALRSAHLQAVPALTAVHPLCLALTDALRAATADSAVFTHSGTLFRMGWGSGDHESRTATVASGPQDVAARVLRRVTPALSQAVARALASGALRPAS